MSANTQTRDAERSATARRARKRKNRELIELRVNAGLTPNALAVRAGISGNTVRAAEAGFYVDPRSQFAIAKTLGVLPLDVFPFERQREAQRPKPRRDAELQLEAQP
jgi:transcriptional regulator with XRE-family HTH domain